MDPTQEKVLGHMEMNEAQVGKNIQIMEGMGGMKKMKEGAG